MNIVYGLRVGQKWYIGSTADYEKRKNVHMNMLKNGTHTNKPMQKAFDSGLKIEFRVLEVLDKKYKLLFYENYWIGKMDSIENGFNKKVNITRHPKPLQRDLHDLIGKEVDRIFDDAMNIFRREVIRAQNYQYDRDEIVRKIIDEMIGGL